MGVEPDLLRNLKLLSKGPMNLCYTLFDIAYLDALAAVAVEGSRFWLPP